jgi:hypothetical protein
MRRRSSTTRSLTLKAVMLLMPKQMKNTSVYKNERLRLNENKPEKTPTQNTNTNTKQTHNTQHKALSIVLEDRREGAGDRSPPVLSHKQNVKTKRNLFSLVAPAVSHRPRLTILLLSITFAE